MHCWRGFGARMIFVAPDCIKPTTCSIAALVATSGRQDLLRTVSLPSIRVQGQPPTMVILITDGFTVTPEERREFEALLGGIKLEVLTNQRAAGAAGAWNTGLAHLLCLGFAGFVAILDDDDAWDANHLSANLLTAQESGASAVVSGLRLIRDGKPIDRELPHNLTDRMFLTGNPGWQGTNTFVSMQAFRCVGGFRDGLLSTNDRDLALRLLRQPDFQVAYTGKWTASWNLNTGPGSVSSPKSESKRRGLSWFWQIYGTEMTSSEKALFFSRAKELFFIERDEIMRADNAMPPHKEKRGDLIH